MRKIYNQHKKILHIAAHLGGGAGKAISGLVTNLKNYENKILLLEKPESFKYYDYCVNHGINIDISSEEEFIKNEIQNSDVVVLNWWGHPLSYHVFNAISGIKCRLVLWSHVNGLSYPYLTFDFLNKFDSVLFTSPCSYENGTWTNEEREYIKNKSDVVYGMGSFIPTELCYKEDYHIHNECKIGYTGTLNYSKLNDQFPNICKQILSGVSKSVFLLYGKYEEIFKTDFFEYDDSFREKICFKGFLDCLETELVKMDIYVYPLAPDNFATTENALIEAMAAGLPIVVLNNPAERNIIKHEKTGLIANNIQEFCEFTELLMSDTELRRELGKEARRYVINNYSLDNNVSVFSSKIDSVLDSEKNNHDFLNVTENDPFVFFIYLCGKDNNLFTDLKTNSKIPNIYIGDSKGSPFHFFKYYYDNERLLELTNFLNNIEENK